MQRLKMRSVFIIITQIIKMQYQNKPTPVALLVIYNPGFKFKYKKYYVKQGVNTIGSHPNSHIRIEDNGVPEKAANIVVTDKLITLQPINEGAIYVLSNIKGKNSLMVPIGPGYKYVVEMEKDFIVCGRKAIMQISDLAQLLQLKGVENEQMFNRDKKQPNSMHQQNTIISKPQYVPSSQFEATIPLDNTYNFEATIPIQQQYYEATQRIQQNPDALFQATLPLQANLDLIPESYKLPSQKNNVFSGSQRQSLNSSLKKMVNPSPPHEIVPSSLRKSTTSPIPSIPISAIACSLEAQVQPAQGEEELEMPQTIRQDSMPATIKQKQDQHSQLNNIGSGEFPPTIQQQDNRIIQQVRKKMANLTKSEPAFRQMRSSKNDKVEVSNFHSLDQKKPVNSIDSFDDLFGNDQMHQSGKTVLMRSVYSKQEKSNSQMKKQIKETHSQNGSDKTEKLDSDKQLDQAGIKKSAFSKNNKMNQISEVLPQHEQSQKSKLERCFVVGKITKMDQQKINKKGFQLLQTQQPQKSDFQLLLVQGELKLSKILLISLIKGRQIKSLAWLNNPNAKISGKVQGFLWQHIQKRKGKGKNIFNKQNHFYLQEELRNQFEQVLVQAGANLVRQLTRSGAKMTIFIIIDQKSEQGRELYEDKKNYKNWSFYGKKMIIESVLMGEEIIDKYKLNAYSF